MIDSYLKRKQTHQVIVGVCFLLTLTIGVGITAPNLVQADTQSEQIKILFVMDDEFGVSYYYIRTVFERYGWNITTTALKETIISCDYGNNNPIDVDILLTEISDVTEYDILTIMPGNTHEGLRINDSALDLIRNAVNEELIVTAWCRAVRVLAAADVIDGRNVTGNAEHQTEYEAAGATFFELVPPITDGNIITSVRSTFYREATCQAIADAVGFYDSNAPILTSASLIPSPTAVNLTALLTVNVQDEALVYSVYFNLYEVYPNGTRADDYALHKAMNATETEGLFEYTIRDLDIGNYTIDVLASDCFLNSVQFNDTVVFGVLEKLPITTTQGQDLMQWVIPGAMVGGAVMVIGVLFVILKRR